jgi:CheY-like chemotaxis protein
VDALDLLRRQRIDAILLDLNMPEMDGEEFLRLLRGSGSRVPVVEPVLELAVPAHEHEEIWSAFSATADRSIVLRGPIEDGLLLRPGLEQRPVHPPLSAAC